MGKLRKNNSNKFSHPFLTKFFFLPLSLKPENFTSCSFEPPVVDAKTTRFMAHFFRTSLPCCWAFAFPIVIDHKCVRALGVKSHSPLWIPNYSRDSYERLTSGISRESLRWESITNTQQLREVQRHPKDDRNESLFMAVIVIRFCFWSMNKHEEIQFISRFFHIYAVECDKRKKRKEINEVQAIVFLCCVWKSFHLFFARRVCDGQLNANENVSVDKSVQCFNLTNNETICWQTKKCK